MRAVFFAIQDRKPGLFLPAGGKGLGGHTSQEPTEGCVPRMFALKQRADAALRCYIQGRCNTGGIDSYTGEYEDDGPEPRKGTERNAADFRVVKMILQWKPEKPNGREFPK